MKLRTILLILALIATSLPIAKAFAGDDGTKAKQYADLAEEAYWSGDLDTSISNYAQAHTLDPDNEDYLFAYVRNLIYGSYASRANVYRAETALVVSQDFVEQHPTSAQGQAAYALALVDNDQSSEAITAAKQAIELEPEFAEAHAYLSLAYRGDSNWLRAQESAQTAVNLDDKSIDAHRALALSLAFTGEWSMAVDEYRIAIRLHPMLDVLYFEIAPYYMVQEDYASAETVYNTIIENNPTNAKAWARKCELFFRSQSDDEALEACQEALRLEPDFPEALRSIGMVYFTMRDYETAIDYFDQCITAMNDQGFPASKHLEQCYYLQGLAWQFLDDCATAEELFNFALTNINLTENGKQIIQDGQALCD